MNFLLCHVLVILHLRKEATAILSDQELDSRVDIQEAEKHLRSEIESFEKLQSKIVAIEENLRKAADSSYVDEQKLMEINSLLLDIDKKVVKPLTDKLMNYQTNLGDSTMRNGETLQLIENFVSKAENVLQTEVSQINSLQNKVDSLNVIVDKEVPAIDIMETNRNNYATFKSGKIIRDHIESHKKKDAKSSSNRSNETTKRKLTIFRTIIEPYVLPAIPVLVILLLMLSFLIYRCIQIRKERKEAGSTTNTTTSTTASISISRSPPVSQVLASDLGNTELKVLSKQTK